MCFSSKSSDQHDETNGNASGNKRGGDNREDCETCGDSESMCSGDHLPPLRNFQNYKHGEYKHRYFALQAWKLMTATLFISVLGSRLGKLGRGNQSIYDTSSSMLSSDLESTSFFDSEDESSRLVSCNLLNVISCRTAFLTNQQRNAKRRSKKPK